LTTSPKFIGYGRQSIDRSDIDAVVATLNSDYLTQGPAVERFEGALAERVGARHAVAVSNGTAALHLACLAAGVGPGDRGATSAITFAASANCIAYCGGEVAFIDIDRDSLGLSRPALAQLLAGDSPLKTVIPVHMAGLADGVAEIRALTGRLPLIEDAAHALGGTYACGRPVGCGAYSDMAIFSFHPVKSITTGEGGAIVTNDGDLARRLRMLRNHGLERDPQYFTSADAFEGGHARPWHYEQTLLGFNYRMTDIQAALGLSQLAKLDRFLARRRDIARRYDDAFGKLANLRLPQSAPTQRARSGLHLYIAEIDFDALKTTRARFMARLRERGIGSQVHYIPVYRHPYYANRYRLDPARFANAEAYYSRCLSLPLFPAMTDEDVERVVTAVSEAVAAA
jgi:UDP-4-amino-4,6-dideoxy-N-acetyl-beta-L-altrosamine transaminase